MRLTIVVDDNTVLVEGHPETVDCSSLVAQNIHVVQWYSTFGEIEYAADLQTGDRQPNANITDISPFQPIIDAWTVEAQKPLPVPPTPPVPAVPQSVTPRQARLALLAAGLLDQVTAAVNGAGGATLITWEYASVFMRTDPLITQIGTSLNLSDAVIDQLFITAATL